MVLITFLKPNVVIHSDTLMMGNVKVYDKHKHLLWSLNVINKSFVSIEAKTNWPKDIDVEVSLGTKKMKKEITI